MLSGAQLCVFDALHNASKRFDKRGIAKRRFRFEAQQIFPHKPLGNDDGFGVSAVQKKQIFAKILLLIATEETFTARRRIGHNHAIADLPIPTLDFGLLASAKRSEDGWTLDFTNDTGQLMAENSGRHDHFCMITALENLQVRAAGERGFNADADFAGF
jgi:hypothetical protein